MALGQGTIFTASEVKNQLREANKGNNIWNKAYANIEQQAQAGYAQLDQQYNLSENQLNNAYHQSVLDAYKSAQQQENSISASNLGQGFKEFAMAENEALLKQAFDSYRINYMNELSGLKQNIQSAAETIAQGASEARTAVDKTLIEQAENMSKYGNAHLEYLEWLYEKNPDQFYDYPSEVIDTAMDAGLISEEDLENANNELGPSFFKYIKDDRVMSTSELTSMLFDNEGNLTEEGIEYFDLVDRYSAVAGQYSFGDFLAEKHPELLDWGSENDYYVYGGKNYQTFRKMTGR